jgi:DedD protein
MAFFKFRFPGNASEAAPEGLSATSGESMEVLRRRARHRLFGSVVLVLTAVVAFPLLFDSQPRPVAVDTPIVIPDRNSAAPLSTGTAVPPAQAPAKPLLPAATEAAVSAHASLEPGKEEVVAPGAPAKGGASRAEVLDTSAPVIKSEPKAESKPEPKTEAKTEAKTTTDSQKAKALLEGKAAAEVAKVIVQVGAFADADKLREVRRKLEGAGLKTYTQTVEKDGKKTTRVRVGPFDSRAEADKAAARIRKLDLPAHLITL